MSENELMINIDDNIIAEAGYMSRSFVKKDIKNRAFINTLGAEKLKKYLADNGIDTKNVYSIHSIARILELIDISDIILPNIHIDVRVVFDKNQIFIPKSHFELEILPDIYIVTILDYHFDQLEILGFFTPDIIDKSKANSDYYFIEYDKLSSAVDLLEFIKNYKSTTNQELSEDEMLRGRELSTFLSDHCIEEDDLKEFLSLLCSSKKLREAVIEYDNFETLSYNVAHYISESEKAVKDSEAYNYDEVEEPDSPPKSPEDMKLEIPDDLGDDDPESLTDALLDKTIDLAGKTGAGAIAGAVAGSVVAGASEVSELPNMPELGMDAMNFAEMSDNALSNIIENEVNNQYKNLDKIDYNKSHEVYKDMPDENSDNLYGLPVNDDIQMPVKSVKDEDFSSDMSELETVENTQYAPQDHSHMAVDLNDLPETPGELYQKEDHVTDFHEISKDNIQNYSDETPVEENNSEISLNDDNMLNLDNPELNESFEDMDLQNSDVLEDLSLQEDNTEEEITGNSDELILENNENSEISDEQNPLPELDFDENIELADDSEEAIDSELNDENNSYSDIQDFENDEENKEEAEIPEELNDNIETSLNDADFLNMQTDLEEIDNSEETNNTEETNEENSDITGSETVTKFSDFDDKVLNSDENTSEQNESDIGVNFSDLTSEDESNDIISLENLEDVTTQEQEYEITDGPTDELVVSMDDLLAPAQEVTSAPVPEEQTLILNQDMPYENSSVISSEQINVGEIPVDINDFEQNFGDAGHLESIYNGSANLNDNTMLKNPARFMNSRDDAPKPPVGLAIFGGIIVLALLGVLGMSALKMFKPAQNQPKPIVGNNSPQNPANNVKTPTNRADNGKIVNMPASNSPMNAPLVGNKTTQNIQQADKTSKKLASSEYLTVTKLSWEVPNYLSYSPDFQQYFQAAGKSLKSVISSDLLLATEYVYSDQIRISTTFNKNGTFQNARIILSSGSKEVDNIVLQSVNQTLKVLKAPNSLGNDESTTLILKIYF